MKEFTIEFRQTIVKEVAITASDIYQARNIAEEMARNGVVEWDMEDISNAAFSNRIDYEVYD